MIEFVYEIEHGFMLSLGELKARLRTLNHEDHQWAVVAVPHTVMDSEGRSRGYAAVGYTNPDPEGNYLAYLFPLVRQSVGMAATEDNLLVCLHPKSAYPLSRGLYPEDGEMRYDFLEDWNRFWEPLRTVVQDPQGQSPVEYHSLPA